MTFLTGSTFLIQVDEFIDLIKTSGLENDLMHSVTNVTVFVPSNDAIDDFRHDMEEVCTVNEKLKLEINSFQPYKKGK